MCLLQVHYLLTSGGFADLAESKWPMATLNFVLHTLLTM